MSKEISRGKQALPNYSVLNHWLVREGGGESLNRQDKRLLLIESAALDLKRKGRG